MTGVQTCALPISGTKGKRYALSHSTVHIHQARGGATGEAADIEIYAKEILRNQKVIRDILSKHTGREQERIARDSDRNFFMDAEAAKEYGIVDEILLRA